MPRRSSQSDPSKLLSRLQKLLNQFPAKLKDNDLREQVKALIPAYHLIRDLGSSLISGTRRSARDRILHYLKRYHSTVISGEELMVVAGIGEWARRTRELRIQFGWQIITGVSISEMAGDEEDEEERAFLPDMKPDDYMLLNVEPDREAAHRWNTANEIRRERDLSVRGKILKYLRANVGNSITGEELRYVAGNRSEWARRVRELRTEHGWPVVTKQTGMPELPVGTYVLELDRQAPPHDRKIHDFIRRRVLRRDKYSCRECDWKIGEYNRADPRILELHHKKPHVEGGENTEENLVTLCNICHDQVHDSRNSNRKWSFLNS
ncbi:MAG: HNH endonuclease [Gammaproteobacteria bacterium]